MKNHPLFSFCYASRVVRVSRQTRYQNKLLVLVFLFLFSMVAQAGTKTSNGNGNWNTGSNWTPAGVPGTGDQVIIAAGHTITLNTNTANLGSITVSGTLIIGNNNTNRNININGNIVINPGGIFKTAGNGGNTVNIGGHLTNNGTFDMAIGGATADVLFDGSANQTITGTGAITEFNDITVNNSGASGNNIVEISSSQFNAASGFLTLTKGILKMSGSFSFTDKFFNTANPTINADEGIWLNNPNVTVTGQNGDTQLSGLLRISAGTYNVGVSADWWLYYNSGSVLIMEGGALNISGAFFGATTTSTINFNQSGGTITVNTAGNNYNVASFEIWATGSTFTKTGGSIVLQRAATAFTDYVNYAVNATVTGGEIQGGNSSTPAGSVFWMHSTPPVYDLVINAANSPYFQLRSNTTVLHDVTINGILDAASQNVDLTVGCNWTNNGIFLPGTATVTLNGAGAQSVGGLLSTSFNNLVVNKSGGAVTLNRPVTITNNCTLTAGIINSTALNLLTFADNATVTGANNGPIPSYVNGPVRKFGNDAFTFPVGKPGAGYQYCAISAPSLVTDAFTAEYIRGSAKALGPISAPGLSHVSNCEYWQLDRTSGLSAVDVTISWSGNSNCNGAAYVDDLSMLTIAHFNGTSWNTHGKNSTTGNVSNGSITWNNVSSFSPFALGSTGSGANPLPVKFTMVKAWPVSTGNWIEWTNATEKEVLQYEVERSDDGRSFTPVLSRAARTNIGQQEAYSELDPSVSATPVYYRIKAVEFQGSVTYSSIVKVSRIAVAAVDLVLYPNPVINKRLNLQMVNLPAGNYTLQVVDLVGRIMFRQGITATSGMLSQSVMLPEAMNSGQYLLQLSGRDYNISKLFLLK